MSAQARQGSYQAVIGLEMHVQLKTQAKLFSDAPNAFGQRPNSQLSVVDVGMPGVLPVLNQQAVAYAIRLGLALGASIHPASVFARKHYFYPDLPKGYQISQFEDPIVADGRIEIVGDDGERRAIDIVRAHLEEDAGKLLHLPDRTSGVDYNRSGVPLLEVVTAPQLHSPAEAGALMRSVHRLVCYLGICAGNLEQGNFRCDANVSVRPDASAPLGVRTELKNINSFRFIEKAIAYEITRQSRCLMNGERLVQETRLYDSGRDRTYTMRSKEDAMDYRYFPDPDLPPVVIDEAMIDEARRAMPPLPWERMAAWREQHGVGEEECQRLCADVATAGYFEAAAAAAPDCAKAAAQWMIQEVLPRLAEAGADIGQCPLAPEDLASILQRLARGELTTPMARQLLDALWAEGGDIESLIDKHKLRPLADDGGLAGIVDEILAANPKQLEQLRGGKDKLMGFFVGQVMKRTSGRADPRQVTDLVRQRAEASAGDGGKGAKE